MIFALLRENLDVNGLEAALAVQAAAGDHDGASCVPEADFATTGNFGAFGLSDGGLPVRLLTIDSLKLADLGLLKVDVEGSELAVISGARRTIERCRPVMYLENDRTDAQGALIESASNLGYRLYWHTPLLAETGLFNAPFRSLNMLCIPSERGTQVRDLEQIDPLNWRSPIQGR